VLPAVLIGMLEAEQTENGKTVRNDRLIAVVETPHNPPAARSLDEIDNQRVQEIEHFFESYNQMEGRKFKSLARRGPDEAEKMLNAAMIR
jgi:inorganic pyrophosphatase